MNNKQLTELIKHSNMIENIWDLKEILNSKKAWEVIKNKKKLTLEDILEVHKNIMCKLRPDIAGNLRICDVCIMSGGYVIRRCPNYTLIFGLLNRWLDKYSKGIKTELEAQQAHIDFEYIHPFEDGNGRTGRIIWLWHREKAKLPFQYTCYERRHEYYNIFQEHTV